jgi:hypothetical protein
MTQIYSHSTTRLLFTLTALVALLSQAGCNERAPATESDQKIEAQRKRAESLKGEIESLQPQTKPAKVVRRR